MMEINWVGRNRTQRWRKQRVNSTEEALSDIGQRSVSLLKKDMVKERPFWIDQLACYSKYFCVVENKDWIYVARWFISKSEKYRGEVVQNEEAS